MIIAVAGDHAGLDLKNFVIDHIKIMGHEVKDYGAYEFDKNDDYPDFVIPLARAVASKEVERGIAVCGSGVGASIVANKIKGVRAALINDTFSAHQGVEDDNMNVLCLGGRLIGTMVAKEIVESFLNATFTNADRHVRRLNKVNELEET
ncbi:MAG TPA: RpiB/LacA/LacB family sugar-phosphate isomerase, partial [Flavisolibacter sp.]